MRIETRRCLDVWQWSTNWQTSSDVLRGPVHHQKLALLEALGQFHLRHPDSYNANEKLVSKTQALYVRIGNDVEQSAFFGRSVENLGGALLPLLSSSDPAMRRAATLAELCLAGGKASNFVWRSEGLRFSRCSPVGRR